MSGAVSLGGLALLDEAVFPEARKHRLDDECVLICGSATKDIKVDPEPVVDVLVDRVILGTQCGWVHPLGERLCLCRGAILIGTTDIDGWQTPRPAKPSKNVCRLENGLISDQNSLS